MRILPSVRRLGSATAQDEPSYRSTLVIYVNGKKHVVQDPLPTLLLVDYLREHLHLTGTKIGCGEGGCGACTVVVGTYDAKLGKAHWVPINSCLRPLCSLDRAAIVTVEGMGSVSNIHPVQERLAKHNGTQCGFCTPGWVTNMYGMMLGKGTELTQKQIEEYFDGNLCRCTGYRPILDAFKTFATDADPHLREPCSGRGGHCHRRLLGSDGSASSSDSDGWVKVEHATCGGSRNLFNGQQRRLSDGEQGHGGCHPGDVEDLCAHKPYPKLHLTPDADFPSELRTYKPVPLHFVDHQRGQEWFRVLRLGDVLTIMRDRHDALVQLVVGNTSIGISKYYNHTAPMNTPDRYTCMVDISRVAELHELSYDHSSKQIIIGAAVSINSLIDALEAHDSGPAPSFEQAKSTFGMLAYHLRRIAHNQVRNAGSWAGNLMLFKRHRDFPSDINVLFTAANVVLTIADVESGQQRDVAMEEMWSIDHVHRPFVIVSAKITEPSPASKDAVVVARSFKVGQRARNSHAHVNAAFVAHLLPSSDADGYLTCTSLSAAYAGVTKTACKAKKLEAAVAGKPLNEETLSAALTALQQDISGVGFSDEFGDHRFRQQLSQSFLYRFFLTCQGAALPERLKSGAVAMERPVSSATQAFVTDEEIAPVSKPVMKIEGPMQCTGEAVYTDDELLPSNALHGAIVYSTQALARITAIDTSEALKMAGVVDVVLASDVPGKNDLSMGAEDEDFMVPVHGIVQCIGAAIGIVLADTAQTAREAARLVNVSYEPVVDNDTGEPMEPVLSMAEAIEKRSFLPGVAGIKEFETGDVDKALRKAHGTVQGRLEFGGQKHFYFEPQTSLAVPNEGVISITASTQAPSDTHTAVAKILGVPKRKVVVVARRCGGGFGAKLTRSFQNSAAAALAAYKTKRPVRVTNSRTADFVLVGGREPMVFDYEAAFTEAGTITALKQKMYMDGGAATDNTLGDMDMGMLWADSCYFVENYQAKAFCTKTNLPVTTSMRAPGVVQSTMAMELILQQVAKHVGKSVEEVQEANFYKDGQKTPYGQKLTGLTLDKVWRELKQSSRIEEKRKETEAFNKANRWKKRGVAMTAVKYGMAHAGVKASASVKVFQEDGSVMINHYGSEIGQGIHTKVVQAAAYALGIPMDSITVTPTATDKIPNGTATGGSATSETAVQAMLNACEELKKRLAPYKAKLGGESAQWKDVIAEAAHDNVCLSVEGWYAPPSTSDTFKYYVFCGATSVVELDILTGEQLILSSDIVYDCGQSLSPLVDIGQIEGGFVQGIGYYCTEEVVVDDKGQLLSEGTWRYKPPSAFDVPVEFKVTLLPNLPNAQGVLRSKATGEPPYMIANSVYFAAKAAVEAARLESGLEETDFNLPVPASVSNRVMACNIQPSQFVLR